MSETEAVTEPESKETIVVERSQVQGGKGSTKDVLDTSELVETEVDNLSFGQGRLLELARVLAGEPRVILLDEPAAGLTMNEANKLSKIIRDISNRGIAVLLIEHDMRFLMPLAQRVAVLDFGVKIADGRPEEIRRNPNVISAYLGETGQQPKLKKGVAEC